SGRDRDHPTAEPLLGARPAPFDAPEHLHSGRVRQGGAHRLVTAVNTVEVVEVEGRAAHAHAELARSRLGSVDLVQGQDLTRRPVAVDSPGLHGTTRRSPTATSTPGSAASTRRWPRSAISLRSYRRACGSGSRRISTRSSRRFTIQYSGTHADA